jgi:hypothetical protein
MPCMQVRPAAGQLLVHACKRASEHARRPQVHIRPNCILQLPNLLLGLQTCLRCHPSVLSAQMLAGSGLTSQDLDLARPACLTSSQVQLSQTLAKMVHLSKHDSCSSPFSPWHLRGHYNINLNLGIPPQSQDYSNWQPYKMLAVPLLKPALNILEVWFCLPSPFSRLELAACRPPSQGRLYINDALHTCNATMVLKTEPYTPHPRQRAPCAVMHHQSQHQQLAT